MSSALIGALLPRSYSVLQGFAGTAIEAIHLARIHGTPSVPAADVARARDAGLTISYDAFGFGTVDAPAIVEAARVRADALFASDAYSRAVAALPPDEREHAPAHLQRILANALAESIGTIDVLDRVADLTDVRGVIVGEDISSVPRTLVRWARARGFPSLCLTHSAGPYNLTSAHFLVDDHYVYGEHTIPWLLDAGVRRDQIHLGTFYGHRDHVAPPPGARAAFRRAHGIADDDLVVVYALAFNQFTNRSEPEGLWWLSVLDNVARAVRALRDRGLVFRAVIKHRFADEQIANYVHEIAGLLGTELLYADEPIDDVLPATDILCGTASNASIEATFYDIAVLDIVTPWHWLIGPQYGADDGVPYVDAGDPVAIEAALAPLIADPGARARNIARSRASAPRLAARPTGDDAHIARELLAILEHRRGTFPARATPVEPALDPPLASIRAIAATETATVLDLTGSAGTAPLLRALRGIPSTSEGTGADVVLLGTALARTTDPGALLMRAAAALAEGGCLIVEFPNARNARALRALVHESRPAVAAAAAVRDVEALLRAYGFAIESVGTLVDPALAGLAFPGDGLATLALGDLTIGELPVADAGDLRVTAFVAIARRLSASTS